MPTPLNATAKPWYPATHALRDILVRPQLIRGYASGTSLTPSEDKSSDDSCDEDGNDL